MSDTTEEDAIEGHVKWFDPVRGFGFVVADDGGSDILLHANVLRNFGRSSVADGARVRVIANITERGAQVRSILSITAAEMAEGDHHTAEVFDPDLQGGPIQPARVKWFDKSKGFGFANAFGDTDDVFIHVEVLHRSGLSDLQPGEAVAIRVADGERGKLATEVGTWESANSE